MKMIKLCVAIFLILISIGKLNAQDPSFSQFFSSPLNINPALTGNINGKWRVISNYRNQWIGPANPYTTGTISVDNKIFQNTAGNYVDENTRIGIGGMMMYDQSLAGALKSNYASFNVSGNVRLKSSNGFEQNGYRVRHNNKSTNEEGAEHKLGLGLGVPKVAIIASPMYLSKVPLCLKITSTICAWYLERTSTTSSGLSFSLIRVKLRISQNIIATG